MLRHNPPGQGHPYSVDPEQRFPFFPVVGEALQLGVKADPDSERIEVEVEDLENLSDYGLRRFALEPVSEKNNGVTVDGGHLAAAQAKTSKTSSGWVTLLTDFPQGSWRYRFHDGKTEQLTDWFYVRSSRWRRSNNAALGVADSAEIDEVEVLDDGQMIHRIRFCLPLKSGERVVGLGERFDQLDQTGLKVDSQVFEQYKSQGQMRRTYMPMPFAHVVGEKGWGFYLQTSRRVWFDLGQTRSDRIMVEAEVSRSVKDEIVVPLRLFSGSPTEVLAKFLDLVGHPQELPGWVFKLWASGNEWNTQAEVQRQIGLHLKHGVPVGNLVIEAWSDESTFTTFRDAQYKVREDGRPAKLSDFSFPEDGAWPDPKGMVDWMHEQDVRVHLWQIPLQKMRPHPQGQALADAKAALRDDVLIRQKRGNKGELVPYRNRGWWFPLSLMPDLTNARAARWWTERSRYLVEEVGIDGFKTDGGEHAWGHDLVYLDGADGGAGNNRFPVSYAKAFGDLLESAGKPPVTFSRAGFAGSQAHGAFWAGDENSTWDAFRWSMTAGLSAASCGIVYWGWDIAGFSGELPSAELYLRAMAASVFVPIMQYHSEFNHHRQPSRDRTPWNIAEQSEDPTVIDEVRELIELRERLVGYLTDEAKKTVASSIPLMRPLFFDWPEDEEIWDFPLQWMLGDSLLISPITDAGGEHSIYLPEGIWVDAWSGTEIVGKQQFTGKWARNRVPVYCRREHWDNLKAAFARN